MAQIKGKNAIERFAILFNTPEKEQKILKRIFNVLSIFSFSVVVVLIFSFF